MGALVSSRNDSRFLLLMNNKKEYKIGNCREIKRVMMSLHSIYGICILICMVLCCSFNVSTSSKHAAKDNTCSMPSSAVNHWKLSLAGGLAGGVSNAIIYPIDTVKTMMQTDRSLQSLPQVLRKLHSIGYRRLYAGFAPAVLGSVPSSMLYFGSYEYVKRYLAARTDKQWTRPAIHILAAACGNVASSVVFAPKEVIKQQLQAYRTGTLPSVGNVNSWAICKKIYTQSGIGGFFPSYKATLARNIPSAMIRFAVFEELKLYAQQRWRHPHDRFAILVAGVLASGFSSGLTTPLDVVKTRIATGMLPPGSPILQSMVRIAEREGMGALYAGMHARVLWSSVFGGIGLSCFEECKKLLHIQDHTAKEEVKPLSNGIAKKP